MTLDDAYPSMRVRTIARHIGPSFTRVDGQTMYHIQPPFIYWTGSVIRVGRMAAVIWVAWDQENGQHQRPVQPDMICREDARATMLDYARGPAGRSLVEFKTSADLVRAYIGSEPVIRPRRAVELD